MPHRHSCHIHQHRHSCRIHHVPHTQGVLDRDTGGEMVLNTKPLTNTSFFKTTTLKSTVTTNKQTVVCSHGWYGMLLPQQYIYIYTCVCACVWYAGRGGMRNENTSGRFPLLTLMYQNLSHQPPLLRSRCYVFQKSPCKNPIKNSQIFMFDFSLPGFLKKSL